MINQVMVILRGLPGSGKSALAEDLKHMCDAVVVSADDFFTQAGKYVFDPSRLSEAHEYCRELALGALREGKSVVIDNTNSMRWEFQAYMNMSYDLGLVPVIMSPATTWAADPVECHIRTKHGVPLEKIIQMYSRWEP